MPNRNARTKPSGENGWRRLETERWSLPAPLVAIADEHRYSNRLLAILEEEEAGLERAGASDPTIMRAVMRYMTRFPDRYHHPKEDLIFDRMTEADPGSRRITQNLRTGHREIAELGARIDAELQRPMKAWSRKHRLELRKDMASYVEELRRHMQLEESQIFVPAMSLLSAEDWQAIDRAIAPIIDPIFGNERLDEFEGLFARYLNRVTEVSIGSIPNGPLEAAVAAAERACYLAADLRRLPRRLHRLGRRRVAKQLSQLGALLSPVGNTAGTLQGFAETCRAGPREYWSLTRDVLLGLTPQEGDTQTPGDAPGVVHHIEDFEDQVYRPSRRSRVSWQVLLTNLVLRVSLKRFIASVDEKGIEHARKRLLKNIEGSPAEPIDVVEHEAFHAEWVRPADRDERTERRILYLPGGAFLVPAGDGHRRFLATLAARTGARGLLVHYRLAPEHPFPAGLEDAIAAYRYLLNSGVSSEDVVLGGDSAGGGLVLSLLQALREEQLPMPAAAVTFSPFTDLSLSMSLRSFNRWRDPMLPARRKLKDFKVYAGSTPCDDPLVSPVFGDFTGFPPILAQVGSTEILLDETLRVARKAREQGVDFEVEVWQGMPHDWSLFSFIPESRRSLAHAAEFIDRLWARKPSNGTSFESTSPAGLR